MRQMTDEEMAARIETDFGLEMTAGSIIGHHHHSIMKNNQDAWKVMHCEGVSVGVVADGCGGTPRAEMGAILGSALFAQVVSDALAEKENIDYAIIKHVIGHARRIVIEYAATTGRFFKENDHQFIIDHMLFTLVGFVCTADHFVIFHEGDGYWRVNDEEKILNQGNRPTYIAYNALDEADGYTSPKDNMQTWRFNTPEVQKFIVATDGIEYLIEQKDTLGPVDQFFHSSYFTNPFALTRKLHVFNEPRVRLTDEGAIEKKGYTLYDDLTMIVGMRPDLKGAT